jgi:hypothetical protein
MIKALRIVRGRWWSLSLCSSLLFIFGQLCVFHNLRSFYDFLVLFILLVRCFSCILPMYLGCTFHFSMIFRIVNKKIRVVIKLTYLRLRK